MLMTGFALILHNPDLFQERAIGTTCKNGFEDFIRTLVDDKLNDQGSANENMSLPAAIAKYCFPSIA